MHSDTGGEFSSDLLWNFCRGEDILQSFTLPASPQQNGIAKRRIVLDMELNLWPRVSLPETSPTLRWTGKVGHVSVFRVWGSRALVRDTSADKLSSRNIPCVAVDSGAARGVAFGSAEPVRAEPGGAEPAGAEPGGAEPEGAEPMGAESEGVEFGGAVPRGAKPGGTEPEGAEPGGAGFESAEYVGAKPWGAVSAGGPAGASPRLSPQPEPLSPQQLREWFSQRTRLWSGAAGAGGYAVGGTGAGDPGAGGAGARGTGIGSAGAGGAGAGDPGAGGVGGAGAGGTGAGGTGAGGTGAGGARARDLGARGARAGDSGVVDPGARGAGAGGAAFGGTGAGGTVQRRPFFVPPPPSSLPPPDSVLRQPDSPLPAPSPYAEQTNSFTQRRELESRPALPVCAVGSGRHVPRPRPPHVPCTHIMTLRSSSVPQRVPLPPPPESSLPVVLDPQSDLARAANPTVPRLHATVVIDPSFESTAVSALVAELVDFAVVCRLDYTTSLVTESDSDCLPSVGGECALGTDVLEDRQEDFECLAAAVPHLVAMLLAPEGDPDAPDILTPRSYAEAIEGPYSSQWQTAMDAEMAFSKSTNTYIDAVPSSGVNIVDGMWIFMVKRPPGSPQFFEARYVARGFTQQQGVDFFQTFSPSPKMTTLWVLLHVAA
ncbi:unnamed protein product [Closterium sp. NIES-54]